MPRFFFNLDECGTVISDAGGAEYPDLEAARTGAIAAGRGIMSDEVREGTLCLSCCIVIHDADGQELERMPYRDLLMISGLAA
jgi:hypothetical protein